MDEKRFESTFLLKSSHETCYNMENLTAEIAALRKQQQELVASIEQKQTQILQALSHPAAHTDSFKIYESSMDSNTPKPQLPLVAPSSPTKTGYSQRIVLTTYPGQVGINPVPLQWGEADPLKRGPVVASRHPSSIKIRNAIGRIKIHTIDCIGCILL